jgi:tetratricopeptide (TPR) repeat protein
MIALMSRAGRRCTAVRRGIVLPLLLAVFASAAPSSAQQRVETQGPQSPAVSAGGNVAITYGLTPEQVQELTKAAVAGATGPLSDRIIDLSKKLGVTQDAALSLLRIIGEREVPLEQLPQKLAEVAAQFQKFQAQLAALNPQNPLARSLVEQAQAEIKSGNFTKAHELLGQAKQAQIAAAQEARELRQKAQEAEDAELIQAAASSAAEGDLAMTELRYQQAAGLFAEAAAIVPSGREDERWKYLNAEATAFYRQGMEFGDNAALRSAIERYRDLLELRPQKAFPQDWAQTQNNLGTALETLGERESGTQTLQKAIFAYREALKESTRERVPLDWGRTQMNLGNALLRLGERERGTAKLQEAVTAYREALKERTRERVPLGWAMTQNNLGSALSMLGMRESSTETLQQAVFAYNEALKERTRERVPLDWAMTQNNLGNALWALATLGGRDSGTERLQQAVFAYNEALKERTRERVPLDWAMTQNNLGTALASLGERESGMETLQKAVFAYNEALKEYTRERVPLDWAMTQENLAMVYKALFGKTHEPQFLDDALKAVDGALIEYRKANAAFYIDKAERLRGKILAMKQENLAAKRKPQLPSASAARGVHGK